MRMLILTIALGVLLILNLCGWSWFLVRFSQVRFEDAKALEIYERVEGRVDNRVNEVVSIARRRMAQATAQPDASSGASRILDDEGEAIREMKRRGVPPIMYSGPPPPEAADEMGPTLGEMPEAVGVEG